jgi:peptide/bleomycin uptake transporter
MWKYFVTPRYWPWSILGTAVILIAVWANVQISVILNEWFGKFYDGIQKALGTPNSVTPDEFYSMIFEFLGLAGTSIVISVIFLGFLVNHWTFRWRQAISEYYQDNWHLSRGIEGASQRVQDDTLRFGRITEDLGVALIEAILTLIAFLPILYTLSLNVKEIPLVGEIDSGLVWVVLTTSLIGTGVLAIVGRKLPGIEFDIQKQEAAYRKELVLGEDNSNSAQRPLVDDLFDNVRQIHFKAYLAYFNFNICRFSWLQVAVLFPYLALTPTILSGAITLGVISQTVRAFGKVAESLQVIIRSWLQIVEWISVYKRLRGFEKKFLENREVASV